MTVHIAAEEARKPSIVHIVGDDLGYNDVWDGTNGYASNPHTLTPTMDSLFPKAIRLTSYYTYKVCSPSRASILTGRYVVRYKYNHNPTNMCFTRAPASSAPPPPPPRGCCSELPATFYTERECTPIQYTLLTHRFIRND